jgi:hypothetical protein
MALLVLLNHAANFAAPAFWLALLLPWLDLFLTGKRASAFSRRVQFGLIFMAGLLVQALGLVLSGQDGKMLTYLALVATAATGQWLMRKG